MSSNLPLAIILGSDNFVAKLLAKKLTEKDLKVVMVDDPSASSFDKLRTSSGQVLELEKKIEGEVNYVFDFGENSDLWTKWEEAKLTIVGVNKEVERSEVRRLLGESKINYRVVELRNIYGEGMEEGWFLGEWLRQAVENRNLKLPQRKTEVRLLDEEDGVEAILRASFFSGTAGENFEIWGEGYLVEELASLLINKAKMTRTKVMETDEVIERVDNNKVEREWDKLRWKPEVKFGKGVEKVLRYFFGKIDEEKRGGGRVQKNSKPEFQINPPLTPPLTRRGKEIDKKEARPRVVEMVVEEEEEKSQFLISKNKEGEITNSKAEIPISKNEEVREEKSEFLISKKEEEEIEWKNLSPKKYQYEGFMKLKEEDKPTPDPSLDPAVAGQAPSASSGQAPSASSGQDEVVEEETDNLQSTNYNQQNEKNKSESLKQNHPPTPSLTPAEAGQVKEGESLRGGKKRLGWGKILTGVGLGLMVAWFAGWVMEGLVVAKGISRAAELIKSEEYEEAEKIVRREKERVIKIEARINNWGLNRLALGRNYQSVLRVGKEVLALEEKGVEGMKLGSEFYKGLWGEEEVDWDELVPKTREVLVATESVSGLLEARLGGDWSWLPGKLRTDLTKVKTEIEKSRQYLVWAEKLMEIWPEIAATEGGRRDYLVLFQNENEIRATGGFIGSFGVLTLEEGKLMDFEIRDIYEIDGQLKGHVEPPEEIRTHLGEASWYMRDANWNPDFVRSSKDIQWFFEKEAGRKVDGVIGINLAVAKEILGVVGEVTVPDFGEKITKDNLYEQAEFYSETKFFPGSNQKASFLGGLGKQLFEEIKILKPEKRLEMVRVMFEVMEKNEMQISLNNAKSAAVIAEAGWDGAIWEGKCSSASSEQAARCVADYVYMVESNFGVNKANYFVTRNVEHKVEISERVIGRVIKINYENTAKNTSWPGGDYKNYMRIYLPSNVNLAEISVTDEGGVKKVYSGNELKVREVGGKKEIGFLVTVPILSKRVVELRYSSSVDLTQGEKFSYLNYIQKQSGIGDVVWVSLVSVPKNWQVLQVEPVATVVGGNLLFNQKVDRDVKMGVEIGR